MHTVSVVLTILNEARSLNSLLSALKSQSRPPDEIIVVDGGSTDGSSQILEGFAQKYDNFHYFVETGVNIAKGRNIGIRKSSGDIIAVTDGGCYPDKDWLMELVRPLVDDKGLDAVAGALNIEASTEFERLAGLLSLPAVPSTDESSAFYGRSSAFTRRLFDAVGGYPEWLYTAEDSLFSQRAKELGFRIGYARNSVLGWRPRPSLGKFSKMFFLYGRGQGRIGAANISGALWWMRWYGLLTGAVILAPYFPWSGVVVAWVMGYLVLFMHRANSQMFSACVNVRSRVMLMIMLLARNISSNLGSLLGAFEHRHIAPFADELSRYARPHID
jgi:glycosyltransferase involved in cell wall biosynthesis